MKRILLLLSVALCSMMASAQVMNGTPIEVKPIVTKPSQPRSAQIAPKVYLSQSYSELSIKFYAPSDSYDLIVEDQSGGVVCQWALITDGASHFYSLPDELAAREYYVRVQGGDQCYEGYFYLP